MTDVFISYARKDRNRVRFIAHALAAEGFAVWWDPEIKPGAKWNAVIRRALDGAAAVVTVWSKASVKSDWVLAETTAGSNRHALAPAIIETCEPPIPFNMVQAADLTKWRGEPDDPAWVDLLQKVRALVEAKRRMVAAGPPPGEAHGAERAASAASGVTDTRFEGLHYRPGASRQGPRFLRLAVGGVVTAAVLTAGIWAAPVILETMGSQPAPNEGAPQVRQAPTDAPTPSGASTPEPAPPLTPEAPVETPTPQAPPQDAGPAPTLPPASTPTPTPPPAGTPPRADATPQTDACVNRLASLCPNAGGRTPIGFATDGRLSDAERGFLTGQMIAADGAIDADVAGACRSTLEARANVRRRSQGSLLDQACARLQYPAPPPPTQTQQPGPIVDAITRAPQTTQTQTPQTRTPTVGADAAPSPIAQASVRLRQTFTLDADSMQATSDGADLWFQAETASARMLTPRNGASLARLGQTTPSYAACAGARYSSAALALSETMQGQTFCIRTANGNLTGITIVAGPGPSPGILSLSGTVWPAPR